LYTISALYINISDLEVREGYFIYKAAFQTSPRFFNEIENFLFYRLAGRSQQIILQVGQLSMINGCLSVCLSGCQADSQSSMVNQSCRDS